MSNHGSHDNFTMLVGISSAQAAVNEAIEQLDLCPSCFAISVAVNIIAQQVPHEELTADFIDSIGECIIAGLQETKHAATLLANSEGSSNVH